MGMARKAQRRVRTGPTLIQASRRMPSSEKALYHQSLGAGKAHITREFLGLTEREAADVGRTLEQAITQRLNSPASA